MSGIYIHIPFCRQACHYCNFHFSTSLQQKERMVEAMASEMVARSESHHHRVETIYFGGGTPSLLSVKELEKLLHTVMKHYSVDSHPEITLEANPDDIIHTKSADWKALGINRFSIGIQSFDDHQLKWMNRAHDGSQARQCIDIIRKTGFDNFSIDLIYGAPEQDQAGWEKDLKQAIQMNIPHLSCYAMTVEEGTALHFQIQKGTKQSPMDDAQADRFHALVSLTRASGYHHYEISNFALPGKESRHNRAYWEGKPYIGFGPSAHSFDGSSRSWNMANNIKYMQAIENGLPFSESEMLSEMDRINEYIMTSLRSSQGIDKKKIKEIGGAERLQQLEKEINAFVRSEKIRETENAWMLTDEGKFLADGIAAALFFLKT